MFRIHAGVPALLAVAGLLTLGGAQSVAADAQYAGTWRVTVNLPAQSVDMWLLRIEQKDGKPAATMLSTSDANLQDSKVEKITADDQSVHFTVHTKVVDFPVAVYFPKDDAKQKKLLGSVPANSQRWFVEMERSDLTKLDARESSRPSPGLRDAQEASKIREPKSRAAAFKALLEKYPDGMLAFFARLDLLGMSTSAGTPDTDLRSDADQLIKLAAPYGPEMKLHALQSQRAGVSQTYVAAIGSEVAGYHTLVVGQVAHDEAPERLAKGVPRHPIPVIVLARLAIDRNALGLQPRVELVYPGRLHRKVRRRGLCELHAVIGQRVEEVCRGRQDRPRRAGPPCRGHRRRRHGLPNARRSGGRSRR